MQHRILKFLTLALAIASLAAFVLPVSAASESFAPRLSINIPTVNFSAVSGISTSGEAGISGYIDIPWIAQYVKGVYSYAVSVAGVLAGVMVVIGGFYILTAGGDASRVQKGKQKVSDALVGLFLVFGAFLALATVNPGLTSFDAIRIKRIQSSPFEMTMHSVMSTTVHTGSEASLSSAGTTGAPPAFTPPPGAVDHPNTPIPPPSGNRYQQLFTTCPFPELLPKTHIERPATGPRGTMFRDRMRAEILPGIPDLRQKINATAQAGANCGAHYNSCGSHATTWWAIAGVGPDVLGQNHPSTGGTTRWNGVSHETPSALAWPILGVACNTVCGGPRFRDMCGARCDAITDRRGNTEYKVMRDCASGAAAKAAVRAMFEGPGGPAGWPDSWTSGLEVGDFVIIYNGNSSCGASHAQIFLGWTSNGRAKMANGQDGGAHPRWISEDCLMRSCGNFSIVTKIFKPRSLAH